MVAKVGVSSEQPVLATVAVNLASPAAAVSPVASATATVQLTAGTQSFNFAMFSADKPVIPVARSTVLSAYPVAASLYLKFVVSELAPPVADPALLSPGPL